MTRPVLIMPTPIPWWKFWARRWSPFKRNGRLDEKRLRRQGWVHMGALRED